MTSAFTDKPDYAPFTAVRNQIPLTEGVSPAPACGADTTAAPGVASKQMAPAVAVAQQGVAAQWASWAESQRLTGSRAVPDYANPEQMNRYTWYRTNGFTKPYPGDTKIYAPAQVPGAYIPSPDTN